MVRLVESVNASVPRWVYTDKNGRSRSTVLNKLNNRKVDLHNCKFISDSVPTSRSSVLKGPNYIPVFLLDGDKVYIPNIIETYIDDTPTEKCSWSKILNHTTKFGYIDTTDGVSMKTVPESRGRYNRIRDLIDSKAITGDTSYGRFIDEKSKYILPNRSLDKSGYLIRTAQYWTNRLYQVDAVSVDSVAKLWDRLTKKVKRVSDKMSSIFSNPNLLSKVVANQIERPELYISKVNSDYASMIRSYQSTIDSLKYWVEDVESHPEYTQKDLDQVVKELNSDVSILGERIAKAELTINELLNLLK